VLVLTTDERDGAAELQIFSSLLNQGLHVDYHFIYTY